MVKVFEPGCKVKFALSLFVVVEYIVGVATPYWLLI